MYIKLLYQNKYVAKEKMFLLDLQINFCSRTVIHAVQSLHAVMTQVSNAKMPTAKNAGVCNVSVLRKFSVSVSLLLFLFPL